MYSFIKYITEFKLTLKYHNRLNPEVWYDNKLRDRDLKKLLSNAYNFADYSGVNKKNITDIVLTGSSANFNYTKYSDIDIHIMVTNTDTKSDALYDKKVKWSEKHKSLKIGIYPIEYYIQDDHEHFPSGQGVYSLMLNKWLVQPKHISNVNKIFKDPKTIAKIEYNIKYTKYLIDKGSKKEIEDYKDKLYNLRSAGLKAEGEFSVENIVYKELRNRSYIDKLNLRLKNLKNNKTL
jgi:hypothetical protein